MLNIFCSSYKIGDSLNAYNSPYKYSIEKQTNKDYTQSKKIWELNCDWVINELIGRVQNVIDNNTQFVFATPPSRTQIFTQKIRQSLIKSFPNSVDISDCFSKSQSFSAGSTTRILSNQELNTFFKLNKKCFEETLPYGTKKLLLADDVYTLGNTFNALSKLIHAIKPEIEIITSVILKVEI